MKLAIQHRDNSFSEKWIGYCKEKSIPYIQTDIYANDFIESIKNNNVTHFIWHISHDSSIDLAIFGYILNSLDAMGIKTYPNFHTRWSFDDKIAQKYLLESINAPMVKSYVYYDEREAVECLNNIDLPIVAKLKRGAGATNVQLLHSKRDAELYIKHIFNVGFASNSKALGNLDQKLRVAKKIKNPIKLAKKVFQYLVKNNRENNIRSKELGYFYFQEFLPNNAYDTRVIIVGNKSVAFKRFNRDGDFRASGSGKSSFEDIDIEMVKIAFEVSNKLKTQSLAYDFIYNSLGKPVIIEISFGFGRSISDTAHGFWTEDLEFHKGSVNLQEEILKNFIEQG